jgi:hypothetical protein
MQSCVILRSAPFESETVDGCPNIMSRFAWWEVLKISGNVPVYCCKLADKMGPVAQSV